MSGFSPFQTIVEHLSVPLLVVRATGGTIRYANPAAEAAFGLSYGAFADLPVTELFLDPRQFHHLITALARRGQVARREALIRRADGTTMAMSIAVESLFYDDEAAIVATFNDLTELRQMESDLKVTAQIEQLLSAVSRRFITLGPHEIERGLEEALKEIADVALADSGFLALLDERGTSVRRVLRFVSDLVAESPAPVWEELLRDHSSELLEEVRRRGVVQLSSRYSEAFWAFPEGDERSSFSLIFVPISYDKKLRALLGFGSIHAGKRWHRMEDTLRTLAQIFANVLQRRDAEEALAAQRDQAEAEREKANKLEAVGLLAGGIAHDFRNFLLIILGNASLAPHCAGAPEELEKIFAQIRSAGLRAKELTEQLLTFSKGGAPVKSRISIPELIEESVNICLRGSRVACEPQIPPELWPIEADAGQINQVLNNLLINANQAMPEGGRVWIVAENIPAQKAAELELFGEHILLTVRDEGPGIPAEVLGKIFDPYFTTKPEGSGLGLATAHSIVKNHDGRLLAESDEGRGTVFRIFLPATAEAAADEESPEEELVMGRGKILVVDDEAPVRELTTEMLQKLGYQVAVAADGASAIEKFTAAMRNGRAFDAVLMDLTIPGGMGGREAVGEILALDRDARVVVSSGYSQDPVMADYKEYGFVDVLPKPFVITQLGQVVRRVLEGRRQNAGNVYEKRAAASSA